MKCKTILKKIFLEEIKGGIISPVQLMIRFPELNQWKLSTIKKNLSRLRKENIVDIVVLRRGKKSNHIGFTGTKEYIKGVTFWGKFQK